MEILWITVDVAAECLPAYGSFFSSAAVADGDAMAMDVDVEMQLPVDHPSSLLLWRWKLDVAEITVAAMTAVCGSSYFSSAVAAETF